MRASYVKHSFSDVVMVNTSYFLVFLRLCMIFLSSYLVLDDLYLHKILISVLILVIIVVDYFDGVTFRSSSYAENLDNRIAFRTLDSVADRIIIQVGALSLLIADYKFLPFYSLILLREIIISGYCSHKYFRKILLYPSLISKVATSLIAISIIVYLLFDPYYAFFCFIIMSFASYSAFSDYQIRYKTFILSNDLSLSDHYWEIR